MMRVEGYTFNERIIRNESKREFLRKHERFCFPERSLEERRKVLSEIYDRIIGRKAD